MFILQTVKRIKFQIMRIQVKFTVSKFQDKLKLIRQQSESMRPNDKDVLVDTMRRLILTMHNNKNQQLKTFDSLCKEDFTKILQNLQKQEPSRSIINLAIRKMSARLIAELLYDNNTLKERFCSMLEIHPSSGCLIVNKIPQILVSNPQKLMKIMKILNEENKIIQNRKTLCWYINLYEFDVSVKYAELSSFSINDFIDPKQTLFGFNFCNTKDPISFKSGILSKQQFSTNSSIYHPKGGEQKQKFYLSNRDKIHSELRYVKDVNQNQQRSSYNNITSIKNKAINPVTERLTQTKTPPLFFNHSKSKEHELKRDKVKSEIQATGQSTAINYGKLNSDRNQTTLVSSKEYSNNFQSNNTFTPTANSTLQVKPYLFNSVRPQNPTKNTTSLNFSPSPKLEYTKLTSLKAKQHQQPNVKSFSSYKPSDDFIRKIKESIKAKQ